MDENDKGRPRAAITGLGLLSALGVGAEEWMAAATEGEPAFDDLPATAPDGTPRRAAPVRAFDVAPLLDSRKAYLDRHTAFLLGAMSLALRQSGWTRETLPGERAGLMVGSAWGGMGTMVPFFQDVLAKGAKFAKPILFPHAYANTAAAMAAIEWGLQGPHEHYASGRLASGQALAAALDTLRTGEADVVFSGGCEALSPAVLRALEAQGGPAAATVPGEGAAVLALETPESSARRKVPVLAWLAGAGLSGTDAARACASALEDAGTPSAAIGAAIVSCGDVGKAEVEGRLRTLFDTVPIFYPSALQGDCLGASAAMDVAIATLLLATGTLPPTPEVPAVPFPRDRPVMALSAGTGGATAFVLVPADRLPA